MFSVQCVIYSVQCSVLVVLKSSVQRSVLDRQSSVQPGVSVTTESPYGRGGEPLHTAHYTIYNTYCALHNI